MKLPKRMLKSIGMTSREFKTEKRKRLRAIFGALNKYRIGCAFCPGYERDFKIVCGGLEAMMISHSIRNWGR